MTLISYLSEEWAQLSSAQKSYLQVSHCRWQNTWNLCVAEVVVTISANVRTGATVMPRVLSIMPLQVCCHALSKNIKVMAAHMSSKSDKDNDAKPTADGKMVSNARNSALTKTPKKVKE